MEGNATFAAKIHLTFCQILEATANGLRSVCPAILPELCFSSTSLPPSLSNYKLLRQQRVPARTLHKFQVHELVHWTSGESTKLKTNFRFFGNFLFSFSPLFFPIPLLFLLLLFLVGVFVFITRLQCSEDSCNLCGFTSSVLGATRAAALGRGRGRFESPSRRGVGVGGSETEVPLCLPCKVEVVI